MSATVRIILHLFSTLLMLGCFLFLLSSMVTNHLRGGTKVNVTQTKLHEGLIKLCIDKGKEECVDVSSFDESDDITTKRNVSRALLSAAIFFAIFGFGMSVIALCKRSRVMHVRFQVFVILSLIITLVCGIASLVYYKKNFDIGPAVRVNDKIIADYSWEYSWGLAWSGSMLVIIPLAIAIYDTITFPKDEYESTGM